MDEIWRTAAPVAIASLLRRWDDFHAVEDAVADALEAAVRQWPGASESANAARADAVALAPDDPAAWLITVATRRMIDRARSEGARHRRELNEALDRPQPPVPDAPLAEPVDDSLAVLVFCCHQRLSTGSRVALALRAVFGLTTSQIGALLGVEQSTIAQRISRAKATIRRSGEHFAPDSVPDLIDRLPAVCHTLHLVFTHGHTGVDGDVLGQPALTGEAIELTEQLHRRLPGEPEVAGLLALMLLVQGRQGARLDADGSLVPLADQDRTLWDRAQLDRGRALLTAALPQGPVGSFQLQAAIAAVHADADEASGTDWPQIVALYDLLLALEPGPVVGLNRAVAVAMAEGAASGLAALAALDAPLGHRTPAVRGHLLHQLGRCSAAAEEFDRASALAANRVERHHLDQLAQRCRTESDAIADENFSEDVEPGLTAPTSARAGRDPRPASTSPEAHQGDPP